MPSLVKIVPTSGTESSLGYMSGHVKAGISKDQTINTEEACMILRNSCATRYRNAALEKTVRISPTSAITPDPEIILTGFILTLTTGLPNVKIGCASAVATTLGIISTALFGIGGIIGGCQQKWIFLVPGLMLQLFVLSYLCLSTSFDERYIDIYGDSFQ